MEGLCTLDLIHRFVILQYLKPPSIDFKRAKKMKGKGGSANTAKVKQIVKNAKKKVSFLVSIGKVPLQVS